MENVLGIMFVYSLSTSIKINWQEFLAEAKMNAVLYDFIPVQKGKRKKENILRIKEVRNSIAKVGKMCFGLSIRENGGVLFIPKEKLNEWTPYVDTILSFPGINAVEVEVTDTKQNNTLITKALLDEVKNNFKDEIGKLEGRDNIKGNLKDLTLHFMKAAQENKLKIDATNNMYNRLLDMKRKVLFYEGLTKVDFSYIKAHINNATKVFEKIFREKQKEYYVANW